MGSPRLWSAQSNVYGEVPLKRELPAISDAPNRRHHETELGTRLKVLPQEQNYSA
jgi:hypothetical protein